VHIVDLATYVANARVKKVNCSLKNFKKAEGNRIGEYILDANDTALMQVELEGGAIGTINTTRWATGVQNNLTLSLFGDQGALKIDLEASRDSLEVCLGKDVKTATFRTVPSPRSPGLHQRFVNAIHTGKEDTATFRRGCEVQRVLDAAFRSDAKKAWVTLRS
jgi:predicted dehydrogenase